jgi:hypothetical protein
VVAGGAATQAAIESLGWPAAPAVRRRSPLQSCARDARAEGLADGAPVHRVEPTVAEVVGAGEIFMAACSSAYVKACS